MSTADPPNLLLLVSFSLLLFFLPSSSSLSSRPVSPISPIHSPSAPSPSATPTSPSSSSTLDPKQLRALQSLDIPTARDPCSPHNTSLHGGGGGSAVTCDLGKPFRHLLSLSLANCSDDLQLSATALKSLSTLTSLHLLNCPSLSPVRLPSPLAASLRSFAAVRGLRRLSGVWLSRLPNLTDLTVSAVPITASSPAVFLSNMKHLQWLSLTGANLSGILPKKLHLNLTHIDLSSNHLRGSIPSSLTLLENLEFLNLSSNALAGELPAAMGDLLSLKNASLANNSLSGSIPSSIEAIPSLVHLDLSSNQLNGTIPKFLSEMGSLKYLNLEKNSFHGVMPFNGTFIKRLVVFKVGDNSNLCYNRSSVLSKLKLGIAPCDKHGLPVSPPAAKDTSPGADGSDYDDDVSGDDSGKKKEEHHHGPSKAVLGVAIGLSSIVFLIVFLVLLSKWCG